MALEELSPALSHALSALVLIALLAGLAFLLQSLSRPLFRGYESLRVDKPKKTELNPVSEGSENTVHKESDFPQNWWTGSDVFELERRAIFSKRWLYLAHRSRFTKPGDYHSFEVAGIPIFLVLGKDDIVRAFHNVCRHRAYTVTRKECGSSMILGCRYHGWSYNTKGQLIKAPHFDNVPGFDKSQNSLFSIHTTTDPAGFIFVNLDASPTLLPMQTTSLDYFATRHGIGRQSTWLGGQTVEGQFNWKIGLRLQKFIDHTELETEFPQPKYKALLLSLFNQPRMRSDETRIFPFTTFHTVHGGVLWYSLSFIPISESSTSVRIDLYSHKDMSSPAPSAAAERLFSRLTKRIQDLKAQFQSHSGTSTLPTYITSASDPADTDAQSEILEAVKSHAKLEKQLGTEVFPATRRPRTNARFEQAEQICKDLDCQDTQVLKIANNSDQTTITIGPSNTNLATLQAALINAGSNVLAQTIGAYRDERPFELDTQALFQFTTCAFVLSPLTFLWLEGLEAKLPGYDESSVPKPKAEKKVAQKPRLNVTNTVAKIIIDQIIGGAWNTAVFITTMGLLRGQSWDAITLQIQKDFWPILIAGFKLWPIVSILNFTVVPTDKRLLVGSLFGVLWAVYLSLMSG
ncbi:hypothetical protein CBS147343_5028 [Aspergillus niger]|nr:hypothetical protein CBS133816_1709 [Aspergillus niger]KAI2843432.1 hypothetical protein CBS11350_5301 [Aspergillus niger]KAI2964232.1 hypothetical protein CBS147323_6429 [Aspergillus niger]KAI2975467.1 hypothetical protein CBS147324_3108 [Aspergillus niger]KAI3013873.1 hypothetical protein CBS147482_3967 [Aspergillus niger]